MGREYLFNRNRSSNRFRALAVFLMIMLLLSVVLIIQSPNGLVDNSSADSTRGENEDETASSDSTKGEKEDDGSSSDSSRGDKDDENATTSSRDTNKTRENRRDSDNDGLEDEEEMKMGTDATDEDTDDDGVNDKDDYYPLNPSLWRSPGNIFYQVTFEVATIMTFFLLYIVYFTIKRKKIKMEKKD